MADQRRATRLDPDPLHVPEPDVRPDDDSGMVIVWLAVAIAALRPATPGALDAAWAEASDVVAWDWTLRLTRLVKGGYRAEAINGNKVEVYTVASDPDDALRELSDIITESHVND